MEFEKIIPIVVLCLYFASRVSDARILSDEEDLELERQLKLINKPPVKSIQTEFGHIVDCIDINKQPSFDHPLLKDHKIQRNPSFLRGQTKNGDLSQTRSSMIGLPRGACPLGTVPIRRATKEDLIESKLLLKNIQPQAAKKFNRYRAYLQMENITNYTGIEGNITVYNPQFKDGQTYANMYVHNGMEDYINSIATGWMVAPSFYRDGSSHFFATYTNDGYKQSGCINYMCPGFVQIHDSVYLGAALYNVSVVGGNLFQIVLSLQQDSDFNWWISVEGDVVGYYPAAILFNLNHPNVIGWGGVADSLSNKNSPPMESGEFPDGIDNHASFTNIQYRNQGNTTLVPQSTHYQIINDSPKCYDLKYDGDKGQPLGFTFQFGGPGGQCNN